jgi:hypothetical protein
MISRYSKRSDGIYDDDADSKKKKYNPDRKER